MMLVDHLFDLRIFKMFRINRFESPSEKYERAKANSTKKIVRRQSRGNISAQNGGYMTKERLDEKSHRAERQIKELRATINSVHGK